MSAKPRVFVSHIGEEAAVASRLKQWVSESFPEQLSIFVSSDSDSIPPGAEWRNNLDAALEGASAMVVICSSEALNRPWISFETGCAWIKRIPVIPVCHSNVDKEELPRPFSRFQALNLTEDEFSQKLLSSLSNHLRLSDVPPVQFARMQQELIEAAQSVDHVVTTESSDSEEPQEEAEGVSAAELRVLALIADHGVLAPMEIAAEFDIHQQKARYLCEELQEEGLTTYNRSLAGEPSTFGLTSDGRRLLVEEGILG